MSCHGMCMDHCYIWICELIHRNVCTLASDTNCCCLHCSDTDNFKIVRQHGVNNYWHSWHRWYVATWVCLNRGKLILSCNWVKSNRKSWIITTYYRTLWILETESTRKILSPYLYTFQISNLRLSFHNVHISYFDSIASVALNSYHSSGNIPLMKYTCLIYTTRSNQLESVVDLCRMHSSSRGLQNSAVKLCEWNTRNVLLENYQHTQIISKRTYLYHIFGKYVYNM